MNVVIIEDEELIADSLEDYILGYDGSMNVIKRLTNIEDSIEFFKHNKTADIIFSDIELTDGLSFEIFSKLNLKAPVIFCTAYNQYALEAFKANAIDYLLKPFRQSDIYKALEKYKTLINIDGSYNKRLQEIISQIQSEKKGKSSILVHKGDKIIPIDLNTIALFSLENKILYAFAFDGQKFVLNSNLNKIEIEIEDFFFRVNRQFLINRKNVKSVSYFFGRKLLIEPVTQYDGKIVVSKANGSRFLKWLEE